MLKKNKFLYFLSILFGLLLFLTLIFYFDKKYNLFFDLINILITTRNYIFISLFLLFALFYFLISSYRWKGILRAFNININLYELFKYKISGFALSYITPTNLGGEPVRVVLVLKYLVHNKNNHNNDNSNKNNSNNNHSNKNNMSKYNKTNRNNQNEIDKISFLDKEINFKSDDVRITASVILDKVIEITTNFFVLSFGLIFILMFFKLNIFFEIIILLFAIMSLTGLLYFFLASLHKNLGFITLGSRIIKKIYVFNLIFKRIEKKTFYKKTRIFIKEVEYIIYFFFKKHRKTLLKTFLLSLIMSLNNIILLSFLILMITSLNLLNLITLSYLTYVIISFLFVIPIPGALGLHELLLSIIFYAYALNPSMGFIVSSLNRLKDVFFTLFGLLYLYHRGVRNILK